MASTEGLFRNVLAMESHGESEDHVSRRHLAREDPITMMLFFAFGGTILIVICTMARNHRVAEREEEERLEQELRQSEEQAVKLAATRRNQLKNVFHREDLLKVLKASDIEVSASNDSDVNAIDAEKGLAKRSNINEDPDATKISSYGEIEMVESGEGSSDALAMGGKNESGLHGGVVGEHSEPFEADDFQLGWVTVSREGVQVSLPITFPICLEQYEEGDGIVLSGNTNCTHGFHEACILDYLVQHGEEAAPCPCCRQIFLPMKDIKRGWWKNEQSEQNDLTDDANDDSIDDFNNYPRDDSSNDPNNHHNNL